MITHIKMMMTTIEIYSSDRKKEGRKDMIWTEVRERITIDSDAAEGIKCITMIILVDQMIPSSSVSIICHYLKAEFINSPLPPLFPSSCNIWMVRNDHHRYHRQPEFWKGRRNNIFNISKRRRQESKLFLIFWSWCSLTIWIISSRKMRRGEVRREKKEVNEKKGGERKMSH